MAKTPDFLRMARERTICEPHRAKYVASLLAEVWNLRGKAERKRHKARAKAIIDVAYAEADRKGWARRHILKLDVDPQYYAEIETWEEAEEESLGLDANKERFR